MHIGAHLGEVGLVFAISGLGDPVDIAGMRRGESLEEDLLGAGKRRSLRSDGIAALRRRPP